MTIIFSSCIIFTPIIFYFKEGQKLTRWDLAGSLLIIVCVALIGFGGVQGEDEDKDVEKLEDKNFYLIVSIIGCIVVGFFFSLTSVALDYVT